MGSATKLIFLDVDGVLNGHASRAGDGSSRISGACARRLGRIVRETGAMVVLSSAWRCLIHLGAMTVEGFAFLLATHGADGVRVIGVTPPDGEFATRGRQISAWLEAWWPPGPTSPDPPAVYLVLDDADHGITTAGHPLLQTDGNIGLSDADVSRAISLLNGTPEPDAPSRA